MSFLVSCAEWWNDTEEEINRKITVAENKFPAVLKRETDDASSRKSAWWVRDSKVSANSNRVSRLNTNYVEGVNLKKSGSLNSGFGTDQFNQTDVEFKTQVASLEQGSICQSVVTPNSVQNNGQFFGNTGFSTNFPEFRQSGIVDSRFFGLNPRKRSRERISR